MPWSYMADDLIFVAEEKATSTKDALNNASIVILSRPVGSKASQVLTAKLQTQRKPLDTKLEKEFPTTATPPGPHAR
jgi:hypothetical protein